MISSRSMSVGFIASARAIATRCCWPPESRSGYSSALSSSPMRREQLARPPARLAPSTACAPAAARASRSRAPSCAGRGCRPGTRCRSSAASAFTSTFVPVIGLAVDDDRPCVDVLEQVDAAKERRLARARGADQADDLVQVDRQVDPVEDLEVAEALRDVLERDEVRVRRRVTPLGPARAARAP